jgi:triosephosphate isomerase
MKKNLIVGNWKMNPSSQKEAKEIFDAIREGVKELKIAELVEVVICPPAVCLYASAFGEGIVSMGAQNIYFEDKGAFTGEISAEMVKDLGAEYVIIGHSERRIYFGETDLDINKKIKKALEVGLKVIFCIGETEEERDAGKKNEILEKQIKRGLDGVDNMDNLNIAYEPVWAIGTGNNCGVEETKESVNFIRKLVPESRILYGGSVKSENSGAYIKDAGTNGLLVGGASLNADEFVRIVKSAE